MNDPPRSPPTGEDPTATSLRLAPVLLGVALVAVAFAVPARPQASVQASFGGGDDPCVAQIVGLVQAQVLWFDGTPFFDRRDFTDATHLYVTESGAPDPTHHVGPDTLASLDEDGARDASETGSLDMPVLVRSGQFYNFTDANGVTWNVTEAYMDVGPKLRDQLRDTGLQHGEPHGNASADAGTLRYYTWIVQIDETRDDANIGVPGDIGEGGEYNFASRVNTTKFTNETREESAETVTHTNSTSTTGTDVCHPDHDHVHRQYEADVWLGRQPDTFDVDCEPLHAVSADLLATYDGPEDPLEGFPSWPGIPEAEANLTASYRGDTCGTVDLPEGQEGTS